MRGSWYEQHYARCGPRYVRTEPDKRAKVCWSARLRALPTKCGMYLLLPASSCLVRVSPTPHTCLIFVSPPALTCLTYSSSSSLSAAFRLVTGPRPKPPSGADILPGGGRAACPGAPPTSLCRAFSCEGGNGSSLSVSVSEPTAPAPLSAFFPPPAAAPAAGFSALRSRSAARALQGFHTPHVTLPHMRVSERACCCAAHSSVSYRGDMRTLA